MAIGEPQLGRAQLVPAAGRIERGDPLDHRGGLAAEGAGVHAHRAAQGAGDADEELEPGQSRPLGGDRDHAIGRAGADREAVAVDLDVGERPRQPDHDAVQPAVANQEIGGDADRRHRQIARLGLEERGQVIQVGRLEDRLGRAADAQPGARRERHLRAQSSAHRRKVGRQVAQAAFSPRMARSWAGKALAQAVMLPAPRQTTRSPD